VKLIGFSLVPAFPASLHCYAMRWKSTARTRMTSLKGALRGMT
jgi:hypothetical protein